MGTQELYKEKSNEELLKLYKETGSLEIKQEIVMRYIYLVKSIALQMRDIYLSFVQVDDIINEGVIAIMSAIDKFDLDKKVKFETYISTLYNKLGYYPSVQEVTEYLDISTEKYHDTMRKAALFNILSLDMVLAEAQGNEIGVRLTHGDSQEQPEDQFLKKELAGVLAEGINKLKENEQLVISLYYIDELNMRQIADVLQVSEPRVSQIHANAIKKLRKHMEKFNEEKERKDVSGVL